MFRPLMVRVVSPIGVIFCPEYVTRLQVGLDSVACLITLKTLTGNKFASDPVSSLKCMSCPLIGMSAYLSPGFCVFVSSMDLANRSAARSTSDSAAASIRSSSWLFVDCYSISLLMVVGLLLHTFAKCPTFQHELQIFLLAEHGWPL